MRIQREKSLLQKISTLDFTGKVIVGFFNRGTNRNRDKGRYLFEYTDRGLTGKFVSAWVRHVTKRDKTKALRMVLLILLGPFASIPYYFFVYNTNSPHKGTNTTPPLPNSWH